MSRERTLIEKTIDYRTYLYVITNLCWSMVTRCGLYVCRLWANHHLVVSVYEYIQAAISRTFRVGESRELWLITSGVSKYHVSAYTKVNCLTEEYLDKEKCRLRDRFSKVASQLGSRNMTVVSCWSFQKSHGLIRRVPRKKISKGDERGQLSSILLPRYRVSSLLASICGSSDVVDVMSRAR